MDFDFTKEPGLIQLKPCLEEKMIPLMSIITPYYNAFKYFEQTFNCVINQTFPWFEWIIVDDGSTQDISLLLEYANSDSRIRIIHQSNKGQASARNKGIIEAASDIIVPLDADDLIIPTYLEYVYWGLKCHPEASWCYTDSLGFQEECYLWKKAFSSEKMKKENLLVCTAAIRKKDLMAVGGYDESNQHYDEDWRLWLELLAMGKYPIHLSVFGFWYRRTASGMGNQVRINRDLKNCSDSLVQQSAQKITKVIEAIEYPRQSSANLFSKPVCSNWTYKIPQITEKKHILMLLPWLEMGGAALFNLELVKKLNKSIYEITIITTVNSSNTWKQRFEEYVSDIFTLPDFLEISNYPEFITYIINSRQIDLIFLSNSYYGYYLMPWIRKEFFNIAIVDYIHMEEWYWRKGGFARTSGVMKNIIEKTYVCNERTRKILIKDFRKAPENVETVYIGVDKDLYNSVNIESGLVRKQFNLEEDRPIILFPCRMHPQKRPFMMLEIAKVLKKSEMRVAFVAVGDGPQLEEMISFIHENQLEDTVFFAGRQADMRPYYKDAAITLICSLKEGLALTAYESLSMGTPVITSDVGGQAELIDEKVGRVIPLMQDEATQLDSRLFLTEEILLYTDAINSILADREYYKILCYECRMRIEESFSTDIMIKKMEQEFLSLDLPAVSALRHKKSDELRKYSDIIDDYLEIYVEYEMAESKQEEIWAAREWYRNLYESNISCTNKLESANNQRIWKVVFKENKFLRKGFARIWNSLTKR